MFYPNISIEATNTNFNSALTNDGTNPIQKGIIGSLTGTDVLDCNTTDPLAFAIIMIVTRIILIFLLLQERLVTITMLIQLTMLSLLMDVLVKVKLLTHVLI